MILRKMTHLNCDSNYNFDDYDCSDNLNFDSNYNVDDCCYN